MELGTLALKSGSFEAAEKALSVAVKANKKDASIRYNYGIALQQLGYIDEAAREFSEALAIKPSFINAAKLLSGLLRRFNIEEPDILNPSGMIASLNTDSIDKQPLVDTAIQSFLRKNDIAEALKLMSEKQVDRAVEKLIAKKTSHTFKDNLFLEALANGKNTNSELEELLTKIRHYILVNIPPSRMVEDRSIFPFILCLIQQCHENQYVWNTNKIEQEKLAKLNISKGQLIENNSDEIWKLIQQLLYVPLYETVLADLSIEKISKIKPKILSGFISKLLESRQKEAELAKTIKSFSPLIDQTSEKVSKQYEKSPYPQWTSLQIVNHEAVKKSLTAFYKPEQLEFMEKPFQVLIAGCGTGQQAIRAASAYGENAQVTAIDLSMASLSYAKRMAQEYNIENIDFIHMNILDVEKLDLQFDVIECIGVLHHMAEPYRGWKALINKLQPHGLMYIGLYSQISRQNIIALRNEDNYPNPGCSDDDARAYRANIRARADGELGTELLISEDFYALNEFRDLVLHESEQQMTIPQIESFLNENNLKFKGFTLDPIIKDEFSSRFQDDQLPGNLKNWDIMEKDQTNLFDGMYVFWCERT